jgi:hypothetical protein
LKDKFLKDHDFICTILKDDDITLFQEHTISMFLIRFFCGSLGNFVQKELPDCCLKGAVRSLWKTRTPMKCTVLSNLANSKYFKSNSDWVVFLLFFRFKNNSTLFHLYMLFQNF